MKNRLYELSTLQVISGALILVLSGSMIGYTLTLQTYTDNSLQTEGLRLNSTEYTFINPLILDTANVTPQLLPRTVAQLQSHLENYTATAIQENKIIQASIYYRDLNNGPWFKTGDDTTYNAASLLKVPLMIAFFKKAEEDPAILEKVITYQKPFQNSPLYNVDSSQEKIIPGESYTILQLIEDMIINSDNLAAYLLIDQIDAPFVAKIFNDLGFTFLNGEITEKFITPAEYSNFLRVLYNGSYLNRTYSEKSLEILSRSSFNHGMRSALPSTVTASIKYGITTTPLGEKQLHECGIIYWPIDKPHILCIMTIGTNFDNLANFVKDVTTTVQAAIKE